MDYRLRNMVSRGVRNWALEYEVRVEPGDFVRQIPPYYIERLIDAVTAALEEAQRQRGAAERRTE